MDRSIIHRTQEARGAAPSANQSPKQQAARAKVRTRSGKGRRKKNSEPRLTRHALDLKSWYVLAKIRGEVPGGYVPPNNFFRDCANAGDRVDQVGGAPSMSKIVEAT